MNDFKELRNDFNNRISYYVSGLKYPKSIAYGETNDLIEEISEFIHVLMVYVLAPCFVLPKAIYSFFVYSISDLGPDAFELPFPTWCDLLSIYFLCQIYVEIDLTSINAFFKDSIRLEKPHGIFRCCCFSIVNCCIRN